MRVLTAFSIVALLTISGCSMIGNHDIVLVKPSDYGYSSDRPITCGGGIDGERKFVSRLRGPEGQQVSVTKISDCCYFRLPAGHADRQGHVSRYELRWAGIEEPVIIYLNSFVRAPVRAPDGLAMAD